MNLYPSDHDLGTIGVDPTVFASVAEDGKRGVVGKGANPELGFRIYADVDLKSGRALCWVIGRTDAYPEDGAATVSWFMPVDRTVG